MRQRGGSEQPVKGRRANGPKARKVSSAAPSIADLQKQVRILTRELKEALERQTATSEVLQVINSSPGDLAPVFDAILENAHSLCAVSHGSLLLYNGEKFHAVAVRGHSGAFAERLRQGFVPGPNHPSQRLLEGERFAQVADWAEIDDPIARGALGAGIRTTLYIPLRREGRLLGYIAAARPEVRPFSEKEIALLESFAAQAVIAMENARLPGELRERTTDLARSVEELTATGDVLKIISRSSVDLETVLDALVETVTRLCHADQAYMFRRHADGLLHLIAVHGASVEGEAYIRSHPFAPDRGTASGRVALEPRPIHIPDVLADPGFTYTDGQRAAGFRTVVGLPLLREDTLIGVFAIGRNRVDPFTNKEIELATTFADQAVIAIENARLFEELRQSLQQLTGTADVLKVISRSAFDLQIVLQTLVESAARLCEADIANIWRPEGTGFRLAASFGIPGKDRERLENARYLGSISIEPGRGSIVGRVLLERRTVQVHDIQADPEYELNEIIRIGDYRTVLGVPLLREGVPIGVIFLSRCRVRPFTDKHIELVTTFADQAVIAIENHRLVKELQESLQQQTATADVLKVISRSTVELKTVLDALLETAARLCHADQAYMFRRHADGLHYLIAAHGVSEEGKAYIESHPFIPDRGTASGRVALERRPIHIPDVLADPAYTYTEGQRLAGFRTCLGLPLLREDTLIGVFVIDRSRVDPFTDKEIELATTFADQAVIAIANARLFEELREREAELRVTFDNMGDGVVMFDAAARLTAWNRNFQEILELPDAFLAERPNYAEYFRYLADRGEYSADLEAELSRANEDPWRELRIERTRPDGRVIGLG